MNIVVLTGRLGRDPEVKYTAGGQAVANFTLATDESYKDKNGEKQKRTEWHRIVIWGKLAEVVQKYVKKGDLLGLQGKIQSREWENKGGEKKTSFEIVCHSMTMLGSKNGNSEASSETPTEQAQVGDEDILF